MPPALLLRGGGRKGRFDMRGRCSLVVGTLLLLGGWSGGRADAAPAGPALPPAVGYRSRLTVVPLTAHPANVLAKARLKIKALQTRALPPGSGAADPFDAGVELRPFSPPATFDGKDLCWASYRGIYGCPEFGDLRWMQQNNCCVVRGDPSATLRPGLTVGLYPGRVPGWQTKSKGYMVWIRGRYEWDRDLGPRTLPALQVTNPSTSVPLVEVSPGLYGAFVDASAGALTFGLSPLSFDYFVIYSISAVRVVPAP